MIFGIYKKLTSTNDAGFDWSQRSQLSTYYMSNIIAQEPTVNRSKKAWAGLERFERSLAVKLGKISVLNGVVYSKVPKRIGFNQVAVPSGYWKMIYSDDMKYKRCFYFENAPVVNKGIKVSDYEVDCGNL